MNKLKATLIPIILLLLATSAQASTIELSWAANTESDLAGYKVYQGTASGSYGAPVDVGNVTSHTVSLTPSVGTTYYFSVTAYDTSGNESLKSDEVSIFIKDSVAPEKPKSLLAKILEAISSFFRRLFGGAA